MEIVWDVITDITHRTKRWGGKSRTSVLHTEKHGVVPINMNVTEVVSALLALAGRDGRGKVRIALADLRGKDVPLIETPAGWRIVHPKLAGQKPQPVLNSTPAKGVPSNQG